MKNKNKLKRIFIVLLCIIILGGGYVGYRYYAYYYRYSNEAKTDLTETNTDSILSEKQLESNLKKYKILRNLGLDDVTSKNSYIIPGLKATKTLAGDHTQTFDMCTSMTPQGVTITEDYLFISAYCKTHTHNSVLYMMDKKTHKFIKEIILPGKPHAGNITYDYKNHNIWVACTGTNFLTNKSTAYLNYVSLESIESYDFNETKAPIKYEGKYQIDGFKRPDYVCYYKNNLFVGTYYEGESDESYIQRFPLSDDGGLETKDVLTLSGVKQVAYGKEKAVIDEYCQGLYLDTGYMLLMQSSGTIHSTIQSYVCSDYQTDVEEMIKLEEEYKTYQKQQENISNLNASIIEKQEELDSLKAQLENDEDVEDEIKACEEELEALNKELEEVSENAIEFDVEAYEERCNEEKEYTLSNEVADASFELPARLEQAMISPYGNYKTYLLFESAAYSYRAQVGVDVVDRVIIMG